MDVTARLLQSHLSTNGAADAGLLEALPVGVLWLNRNGSIERCNRAAITLLDLPLLGESWRQIVATRLSQRGKSVIVNRSQMAVTVASTAHAGGQLVVVTEGGPADVASRPALRAPAHRGAGTALADGADAHAERQGRLAELGQIAAGLAHQLRTPLAAAQLYLDLARDAEQPRYLEHVQTALDSIARHSESLLAFARGGIQLTGQMTLAEWREHMTRQGRALLERGVKLSMQAAQSDETSEGAFVCNPHLLVGAGLNLVQNAIQASPDGASVEVSLTCSGGSIRLNVNDHGDGVSEQLREALHRSFVSGKRSGTGLGLTMARLIARAHGGDVALAAGPAGGTCASLWITVASGPSDPRHHERMPCAAST